MPDLLLELFSEEIPARMQARAAEDLRTLVTDRLVGAGLTYRDAGAFATPRRLTLHLTGLPKLTPAMREEWRGPRTDAPAKALEGFLRSTGLTKDQLEARDDKKGKVWFAVIEKAGRPAAEVIAEAVTETVCNFPWPKSMRWGSGTLRWVRPLHSILCLLSDESGAEIVPLEIDGIASGDTTEGHRFMAPGRFRVAGFEDYVAKLKARKVILDPAERSARIEHDARQLAFAQGFELVEDRALLAEVAGLVEWPVTMMGEIGAEFLDLPPEVLRTSMKEHQKFFSVRNPKTDRIERFVTVANIEARDGGQVILAGNRRVLAARLDNARFFWDNDLRRVKDRGMDGMAAMAKPLEGVVFHAKLGTQKERIARIAALAREIAPKVGADPDLAGQAAQVAKADLASEMVFEFPELQGVMGRYYAKAAGLPDAVANACEGHYRPLGPADAVPTEPVSVAVALADKIDMLTGFWAIDEKPTGSKDPFALRRAALGILRILLDHGKSGISVRDIFELSYVSHIVSWASNNSRFYSSLLEYFEETSVKPSDFKWTAEPFATLIDIDRFMTERAGYAQMALMSVDFDAYADEPEKQLLCTRAVAELKDRLEKLDYMITAVDFATADGEKWLPYIHGHSHYHECWSEPFGAILRSLLAFFADRLKVALRDQGVRHDVIQACFELGGQDDLVLLVNRVRALQDFLATEDGEHLLVAYRRAANIVAIEEKKDGVEYSGTPEAKFAEEAEERALFAALDAAEPAIAAALKAEDFAAAMAAMAKLRPVVDSFFDKVTVNAENKIVRRNRLCLLNRIRQVMRQVAVWEAIEG